MAHYLHMKACPKMDTEPRIRTTQAQIQFYLKFCQQHPEINKHKVNKSDKVAMSRRQSLWIQLAEHLNNITGPSRSAKKWQATLLHWKSQVRSRMRKRTEENSKKEIAYLNNVSIENQYVTVDEATEINDYEIKMEHEEPPMNISQSSEFNEPQIEVELNAIQSEIEYSIDTHFYKRDDKTNNDSAPSRPSTPGQVSDAASSHTNIKKTKTKGSKKTKDVNLAAVCNTIMKSLEARKERDEILFMHQQNLMRKLDHSLTLMTEVLEKIDAKLDIK